MVSEVNKIISNTLLIKRSIQLPQIGSLYVESLPAQLTKEGKSILPTRSVLRFTQQIIGESIIDEISKVGGCSEEVATTIYNRWCDSVKQQGEVVIGGVGVISQDGVFSYDKIINERLNPTKPRSIGVKRQRRDTWIWIVSSIVAALVIGFVVFQYSGSWISTSRPEPSKVLVAKETKDIEATTADSELEEVVVTNKAVEESAKQENVVEQQEAKIQEVVSSQVGSGAKYRVVYGVFSVSANIERAKSTVAKYNASIECRVYPYGKSEMVSIFESNNIEDCQTFIASNKGLSEGLWIDKRK